MCRDPLKLDVRSIPMRACAVATILLLSPLWGFAADQGAARISGIYSNLKFSAESGDLIGMELLVLPGPGDARHWRVLFQLAEGGGPMSALVDLQPVADHFEFRVPPVDGVPEMRFLVRFAPQEALIKNAAGGPEEHLVRGRSYWQ